MNKKKHAHVRNTPVASPEAAMMRCSTSSRMVSGAEYEESPAESSVWLEAFISRI